MGLEGMDNRISRLEQRLGLAPQDLIICLFYTEGIDGPILPGQEPAMIIRYTATGERITTYGPDWEGEPPQYGPQTKVYRGFDAGQV